MKEENLYKDVPLEYRVKLYDYNGVPTYIKMEELKELLNKDSNNH